MKSNIMVFVLIDSCFFDGNKIFFGTRIKSLPLLISEKNHRKHNAKNTVIICFGVFYLEFLIGMNILWT